MQSSLEISQSFFTIWEKLTKLVKRSKMAVKLPGTVCETKASKFSPKTSTKLAMYMSQTTGKSSVKKLSLDNLLSQSRTKAKLQKRHLPKTPKVKALPWSKIPSLTMMMTRRPLTSLNQSRTTSCQQMSKPILAATR